MTFIFVCLASIDAPGMRNSLRGKQLAMVDLLVFERLVRNLVKDNRVVFGGGSAEIA